MSDGNGFAEMADYLGTLSDVGTEVSMEALKEAADFYTKKLIPSIPKSLLKRKHMRDHVKVTIEKNQVVVHFEDTFFYWRFPENGTVNQKAQHFASGTFERHKKEIERIMTSKIIRSWENE